MRALAKGGLSVPPDHPPLRSAQFTSRFLRDQALAAGRAPEESSVIHWGIDLDAFPFSPLPRDIPRRLLFVGQVMPHKGVHTAIEALGLVSDRAATLTIVGGGVLPAYEADLQKRATSLGLVDRVTFRGRVPRGQLRDVYACHDILVFPSVWEEPFPITPLEAMASGLAVVTTLTGGTPELVVDRTNALTFPPGDAAGCACRVTELLENYRLFDAVRRAGRATVESRFRLGVMVDQIEAALCNAIS